MHFVHCYLYASSSNTSENIVKGLKNLWNTFKMQIILCCTILFSLILNMLCTGQENEDWNITFDPPEVTAVSGVCALISCTFTYPNTAEPINYVKWFACKNGQCKDEIFKAKASTNTENKLGENESKKGQIEMLEPDLTKNNCSIIMKDIKAEDQMEYSFRVEGSHSQRNTYKPTLKIIIQDVKTLEILGNGKVQEGDTLSLSCTVESHPPSSDPVWSFSGTTDTFMNQTSAESLTITNVTQEHAGVYICMRTYRNKTLNTYFTISVIRDTNESKVNESVGSGSENMPQNDTRNITGVKEFFKNLDISKILTFVAGMACSAFIFSVVLCCWVSCLRGKKHKVPTANPDTEVNLEMVQTDVAQTGSNEETPLHVQLNGGNPHMAGLTDRAEEEGAVGMDAKEVDYASIDYSLLKDRMPEEGEKEPTDTDYAEIKRDKRGDGKEREVLQDGDDQIETQDQMEGEEEIYSNSLELKS
ncbi:hypothetical protein G5714_015360 [Onychostoma macrolepis]|uniref:Ig-like domain-containing protein n=1 Tax=Onychostoma macrolepis TaxID=369639 RepID=A0A7J6CCL5_9TELE|nr:hypothetical protein G5714_015360 [Onychostoma macrolepis]